MARELTEAEQVEYNTLEKELVAQGGPTKGKLKAAGHRNPDGVARLVELGWVNPEAADIIADAIEPPEAPDVDVAAATGGTTDAIAPSSDTELAPLEFAAGLLDRAKKVGLTQEQIETYPTAADLLDALNAMSPKTNPDIKVQPATDKEKVIESDVPDKFEFVSKLERKFISKNRAQHDEQNLQAELRRINRIYGAQKPVKIVATTEFEADKDNNLCTAYVIYLK